MISRIKRALKISLKLLFPPVVLHMLSRLMIRDRNIWIFGSHGGTYFSDNVKYFFLYLYLRNFRASQRYIWISTSKKVVSILREKGFEAFLKWSFLGLYYSLKAKYYFFSSHVNEINYFTSGNATLINLNHHAPIKKMGVDITKGVRYGRYKFRRRMLMPYLFKKPDYILSTSKLMSEILAKAHQMKRENLLDYGFPRTDLFFKPKSKLTEFIEIYEEYESKEILNLMHSFKKVLIYMPTWRDSGRDFLKESGIDFAQFSRFLKERNILLLIKLHGNTKLPFSLSSFQNIQTIPKQLDVYPLLPFTDCLITDYSSSYIDYLLLDKEIIFFPFDIEKYTTIDRELYFTYDEITPGIKVRTYDELKNAIDNFASFNYRDFRTRIRKQFWDNYMGHSCEKIAAFFL